MPHEYDKHKRRSTRLKGYDYSQPGVYFLTICTQLHRCLFGEIVGGKMQPNLCGSIVSDEWLRSFEIRDELDLDEWILVPNHIHGLVIINDTHVAGSAREMATGKVEIRSGRQRRQNSRSVMPGRKPRSISSFVAQFKSTSARRIHKVLGISAKSVWQRNYYDHIIRNEKDLDTKRQYIAENPLRWEAERENLCTYGRI